MGIKNSIKATSIYEPNYIKKQRSSFYDNNIKEANKIIKQLENGFISILTSAALRKSIHLISAGTSKRRVSFS